MSKSSSNEYDPFILDTIFPNAQTVFSLCPPRIKDLAANCLFVLDTNALMAPYKLGAGEAADISKVYERLNAENRLFVPVRAVQEFARNRNIVLKDMYDAVYQRSSTLDPNKTVTPLQCPMLEGREAYTQFTDAVARFAEARRNYTQSIDRLLDDLKDWSWDDPISRLYAKIFKGGLIFTHDLLPEKVKERFDLQRTHKVPPGYKDGAKADGGIGDLLIWLSILKLGKDRQKNILFVCNEEKHDWAEKIHGTVISVRSELAFEYHASTNQHFGLVDFTRFLSLVGAAQETVQKAGTLKRDWVDWEDDKWGHSDELLTKIMEIRSMLQCHFAAGHGGRSNLDCDRLKDAATEFEIVTAQFARRFGNTPGTVLAHKLTDTLEEILAIVTIMDRLGPKTLPLLKEHATKLEEACSEFIRGSADWIDWYRSLGSP